MKRKITPKLKNAALELYELQRSITKVKSQLSILEAAESALIRAIKPTFSDPAFHGSTDLLIQGMSYTVKYKHVERDVIDTLAVARVFARLGKPVPKKHSGYDLLKVVKSKQ